jgi:hypothetical protein
MKFKLGDTVQVFYARGTHVGAADTTINWIQLPQRADGKRYRLLIVSHYQNSAGAINVQTVLYDKSEANNMNWTTDSVSSTVPTPISWSGEIYLPAGMKFRFAASNLGAGKVHDSFVVVEVID